MRKPYLHPSVFAAFYIPDQIKETDPTLFFENRCLQCGALNHDGVCIRMKRFGKAILAAQVMAGIDGGKSALAFYDSVAHGKWGQPPGPTMPSKDAVLKAVGICEPAACSHVQKPKEQK